MNAEKYQQLRTDSDADCNYVKYKTTDGKNSIIKLKYICDDGQSIFKLGTEGTYKLTIGFYYYKEAEKLMGDGAHKVADVSYIPESDKHYHQDGQTITTYYKASIYNVISEILTKGENLSYSHDDGTGFPIDIDILEILPVKKPIKSSKSKK